MDKNKENGMLSAYFDSAAVCCDGFINGPVISARSRVDQTYIKVEVLDAADDTSFEELPLESSGLV